jgi:hypothetical protein
MPTGQGLTSVEVQGRTASVRQCPYCGKMLSTAFHQCPHCREALPQISKSRAVPGVQRGQFRRGLLYMLLAVVIHFFAGGYSALNLPFPIIPQVTAYLSPVVFLGGLGLTFYGIYCQYVA